jgi:hypothetical protein
LHHNNVTSHTSFSTWDFLQKNLTDIPHPHYSPYLATFDFSLFPQLKIPPFLHNFDNWGRIIGSAEHLHRTPVRRCIQKRQKLRERCIWAEQDYFEGDDGQ